MFWKPKEVSNLHSSHMRDVVNNFKKHKLAMVSLTFIVFEILMVIILPLVMDLDPYGINAGKFFATPSAEHILGVDDVGRDVFSRLIYGGRNSLMIGIASATLGAVIGIPLGMIAGYYEGPIRSAILRLADVFMALPNIIVAMFIVAVVGSSMWTVVAVLGFLGWTGTCRLAYSRVLSVKENEYVEAARAIGTPTHKIILKYILPNSVAPLLVAYSMGVAGCIVAESSLSFLGIGIQPPEATWGNMIYLAQSLSTLTSRPWLWVPAGVCLVATVLSINFIGDGLRDALDPKMKV